MTDFTLVTIGYGLMIIPLIWWDIRQRVRMQIKIDMLKDDLLICKHVLSERGIEITEGLSGVDEV